MEKVKERLQKKKWKGTAGKVNKKVEEEDKEEYMTKKSVMEEKKI